MLFLFQVQNDKTKQISTTLLLRKVWKIFCNISGKILLHSEIFWIGIDYTPGCVTGYAPSVDNLPCLAFHENFLDKDNDYTDMKEKVNIDMLDSSSFLFGWSVSHSLLPKLSTEVFT